MIYYQNVIRIKYLKILQLCVDLQTVPRTQRARIFQSKKQATPESSVVDLINKGTYFLSLSWVTPRWVDWCTHPPES